MKSSRAQEVRVGIITVVAVLVTVAAIIWGKGIGLGKDSHQLRISFAEAGGVEPGTPVTIRGVRKGSVTSVQVRPGDVLVTALIDADKALLHSDATASIQMLELTGGKKIELVPGAAAGTLADDAVIRGETPSDISTLVSGADQVRRQVSTLLGSLDTAVHAANAYLADKNIRYSINSTLENVRGVSQDLGQVVARNSGRVDQLVGTLNGLSADLKSFFDRMRPQAESAMDKLSGVADDARQALHTTDATARHADTLLTRIDSVVASLHNGQGVLPRLLHDKRLAAELEQTLKSIRTLVDNAGKYGINTNVSFGRQP